MMLSRSSFSIRRLISQRRPRTADDGGSGHNDAFDERYSFENEAAQHRVAASRQQRSPKTDQPRSPPPPRQQQTSSPRPRRNSKKNPVIIRRSTSLHRISGPIPPLPDGVPHSSASSTCSCDNRSDVSRTASGKRKAALCLSEFRDGDSHSLTTPPPSSSGRRHLSPAPSPSPRLRPEDARASSGNRNDRSRSRTPERPPRPSREGTVDLLDLVEDRRSLEGFSENVQQLIRETDQAFRAVGTALAEARLASDGFAKPEASSATPAPRSSTATPPKPLPFRLLLKKQPPKPTIVITSPLGSPARTSSVSKSKPKRKNSKKGRREAPQRKGKEKRRGGGGGKQNPRWTLSENMAEILTGQFFKRVEADEMITPEQIAEFRASREQLRTNRKSTESMRSVESDDEGSETPVEPFHLEDLPSRVRAAGVKTTVSPIDQRPPVVSFDEVIRRDFSMQRRKPRPAPLTDLRPKSSSPSSSDLVAAAAAGDEAAGLSLKMALGIPSPPLKNPLRFISRPLLPQLPTIPEVLVTTPQDDPVFDTRRDGRGNAGRATRSTFPPVHDEDFLFLPSSPYTLTMPAFRHGRVRFSKTEVGAEKEMTFKKDDTLDWTAFQMAILGGAGDVFGECEDFRYRCAEAEEADELAEWWDGFGFEHAGLMIPESEAGENDPGREHHQRRRHHHHHHHHNNIPRPEASPSTASYSPISSSSGASAATADSEPPSADLPMSVAHEHPNGFWNEGKCDADKFYSSPGIKRWTVEGHPKRYGQRGSITSEVSLPQSPMLPLVVRGADDGATVGIAEVEAEVVPMGYNLGHDLGDFLRWEAEHVYASVFSPID